MEQFIDAAYNWLNNVPPSLCAICVGLILIVLKCLDKGSGKINGEKLGQAIHKAVMQAVQTTMQEPEVITQLVTDEKENLYQGLSASLTSMKSEWSLNSANNGITNTSLGVNLVIGEVKVYESGKQITKESVTTGTLNSQTVNGMSGQPNLIKLDEVLTKKHIEKLGPLAVSVRNALQESKGQASARLINGGWAKLRLNNVKANV